MERKGSQVAYSTEVGRGEEAEGEGGGRGREGGGKRRGEKEGGREGVGEGGTECVWGIMSPLWGFLSFGFLGPFKMRYLENNRGPLLTFVSV